MANGPTPSLTAWWPHAEKLHHAALQTGKIHQITTCFCFFFPLTWPARVSEVIPTPGCQGVDPNILRSNFLKIRLNVGWIILSDLLIWQFVLTYCVQCGHACFWLIFCLMPAEQFNLLGRLDVHVIYNILLIRNHDGYCAWFHFWGKQPSCSVCHPLTSLKKTKKQYTQRTINIFTCSCVCASEPIIECIFPRFCCLFTLSFYIMI